MRSREDSIQPDDPPAGKSTLPPGHLFAEAVAIMARLRAPGGCPWDREQSFSSIRKYTLEETWEVLDAIEREHWPDLAEELGDLLLQILFYSQMAAEAGHFSISDVLSILNRKLVRRHPHVFGEEAAANAGNRAEDLEAGSIDAAQVLVNWDKIKRLEKDAHPANQGRLAAVPRSMPALLEAGKLGSKAAKAGFDWPDVAGVLAKLREEIAELETELMSEISTDAAVSEELGDLLFTAANLARHLNRDPELALRDANAKFRRRFETMEAASRQPLEDLSADQLETLWSQAKNAEPRD